MRYLYICFLILLALSLSACASSTATATPEPEASAPGTTESTMEADMSFKLTSDAFASGQSIPAKYSCIGKNISPALAWNEPPAGTQSFALIVDDPDAPGKTWVHWVLFNIKPNLRSLQEDLPVT